MTMNSNQQGQSVARRIYVHCPKDNLGFSVEIAGRETRIPCDSGTHDLDAGFPHGEFWEYCCDCATFAPSPVKQNLRPSDACPSCTRRFVKRFLCAHCKTIVCESDNPNERRQVKLSQNGAPVGCPACLARTNGDMCVHDCPDFHALFTTTRERCPLCESRITPPIKFPVKVKDFFSRYASEKIFVDSNDDSSLTEAINGAFALVRYTGSADVASLLPKTDSVGVLGFDSRTARFFDTSRSSAGEVVIEQPAEVRRVGDKWMLTKHGRLSVIAAAPESVTTPVAAPANNTVTCPNCQTEVNARYKFCNRCKHSLVGVRDATTATDLPPPSVPESENTTSFARDVYQETPTFDAAQEGSSTDSFINQPLAFINQLRTQKSSSTFLVAGGVGLLLLVIIALLASSGGGGGGNSVTLTPGASTESKLQDAIARGNFIAPQGSSASDYYNQLKSESASSATLSKYSEQVVPLLTAAPYEMLTKFALVGSDEPLQSEWDEAARKLEWASELKPNDKSLAARSAYCTGRSAYIRKQSDDALSEWQRAADLDKSWAVPVNGVGLIYNERKEYSTARTYLREAIKRNPSWAVPYSNMGTSYFFEKDYNQAESYYRRAVELAPDWARPHAWLGDIAGKREYYCDAVSEYQTALNLATSGMGNWNTDKIQQSLNRAQSKCNGY